MGAGLGQGMGKRGGFGVRAKLVVSDNLRGRVGIESTFIIVLVICIFQYVQEDRPC